MPRNSLSSVSNSVLSCRPRAADAVLKRRLAGARRDAVAREDQGDPPELRFEFLCLVLKLVSASRCRRQSNPSALVRCLVMPA